MAEPMAFIRGDKPPYPKTRQLYFFTAHCFAREMEQDGVDEEKGRKTMQGYVYGMNREFLRFGITPALVTDFWPMTPAWREFVDKAHDGTLRRETDTDD